MSTQVTHFSSIATYLEAIGYDKPAHPMLAVCQRDGVFSNNIEQGGVGRICITTDFYVIAIKNIIEGDMFYGRTKYDFSDGSMMFAAPRQEFNCSETVITKDSIMIVIHEDFIKGDTLFESFKKYGFFSYAVNEALHLSPHEEQQVRQIMLNIKHEYLNNPDEFTKELLLAHLDTLLKYANRYYKRQFLNREVITKEIVSSFNHAMRKYFEEGMMDVAGLPKIEDIAERLKLSPRYLSDNLRAATGKSTMEHIHLYLVDEAKNMLLKPYATVAEVAYQLGFDYPQYFSRLFKKKTGMSPKEYRENHILQ
jgi:AraC-like DNA-binding protein